MFKFLSTLIKKKPQLVISKLEQTAVQYQTLKLSRLSRVFSSDMSIISISVCMSDIRSYNNLLRRLVVQFRNHEEIRIHDLPTATTVVALRDFFIDQKQHYINPEEAMQQFCSNAFDLLMLYDKAEKENQPDISDTINMRKISLVVSNLTSLIESFNQL